MPLPWFYICCGYVYVPLYICWVPFLPRLFCSSPFRYRCLTLPTHVVPFTCPVAFPTAGYLRSFICCGIVRSHCPHCWFLCRLPPLPRPPSSSHHATAVCPLYVDSAGSYVLAVVVCTVAAFCHLTLILSPLLPCRYAAFFLRIPDFLWILCSSATVITLYLPFPLRLPIMPCIYAFYLLYCVFCYYYPLLSCFEGRQTFGWVGLVLIVYVPACVLCVCPQYCIVLLLHAVPCLPPSAPLPCILVPYLVFITLPAHCVCLGNLLCLIVNGVFVLPLCIYCYYLVCLALFLLCHLVFTPLPLYLFYLPYLLCVLLWRRFDYPSSCTHSPFPPRCRYCRWRCAFLHTLFYVIVITHFFMTLVALFVVLPGPLPLPRLVAGYVTTHTPRSFPTFVLTYARTTLLLLTLARIAISRICSFLPYPYLITGLLNALLPSPGCSRTQPTYRSPLLLPYYVGVPPPPVTCVIPRYARAVIHALPFRSTLPPALPYVPFTIQLIYRLPLLPRCDSQRATLYHRFFAPCRYYHRSDVIVCYPRYLLPTCC